MKDVSLVILTWNRKHSVEISLKANLKNAGYPIKEIIHVDNGSEKGFTEWFKTTFNPSVQVLHSTNLGVAKGYNRGLLLATGEYICITGCDRVMPYKWLGWWMEAFKEIPNTGCISCYTGLHKERWRGEERLVCGIKIRPSIPVEARIHSREFLLKTGFWREDFGLYGYEDSEWSDRAERVSRENGFLNYSLPDMGFATHLSDEDAPNVGEQTYKQFKDSIHNPDDTLNLNYDRFQTCWKLGSPYYNPYSRIEPKVL